ncbi:hypothetical protein ACFOLD_02080 [Kocuria carniphila]|uniref:hypothetical protein n=2 Tax=Kocuria carniphila TaxID=262208 RepID=UPI00361A132F
MTVSPGPDQARDTPRTAGVPLPVHQQRWHPYAATTRPPAPHPESGRDMSMFDALAVWAAVDYQANLARLTDKQSRALRAVVNQTIRYQRCAVPVTRKRLAGLANIHPNSLGAALQELAALGFIVYVAGRGKTKSRIEVVIPQGWELHEQDLLGTEGAATATSGGAQDVAAAATSDLVAEVATAATSPVPVTATSEVAATATTEVATSATRTGEINEKTETRRRGGGEVVALPTETATAPAAPVVPDVAQSVLDAYCWAMAEAGTPVVKAETLLPGIRAALRAGYSPRSVLMGLGMWDSEGFRSPRQVEEWVQKSARQAPEPAQAMSVPDLLAEGRERYTRFLGRKVTATPSKADLRRQRSLAAIREFTEGPP